MVHAMVVSEVQLMFLQGFRRQSKDEKKQTDKQTFGCISFTCSAEKKLSLEGSKQEQEQQIPCQRNQSLQQSLLVWKVLTIYAHFAKPARQCLIWNQTSFRSWKIKKNTGSFLFRCGTESKEGLDIPALDAGPLSIRCLTIAVRPAAWLRHPEKQGTKGLDLEPNFSLDISQKGASDHPFLTTWVSAFFSYLSKGNNPFQFPQQGLTWLGQRWNTWHLCCGCATLCRRHCPFRAPTHFSAAATLLLQQAAAFPVAASQFALPQAGRAASLLPTLFPEPLSSTER